MMTLLATATAAVAVCGVAQSLVASWFVRAFSHQSSVITRPGITHPANAPTARPAVTVLKPLHGDEPLLEAALATLCQQDYPAFQIVFGVQEPDDPAVAVVASLRRRFPDCDIALVINPALHGANRKVGNLINMLPSAAHDVLVIADSDIHVQPDYLDRLVIALLHPGVGLVTTLYAGLPARINLVSRLGATQITHGFLPGAVLARAVGRRDCLGATMCLRRHDLTRIGGFPALVNHLADDNVLGRRISALGLQVALADTVPLTTVPETTWRALFRHELRWARTIRTLEPMWFAMSALQYPLAWALLTMLLSGAALWSVWLLLSAWVLRAVAALAVDQALAPGWTALGPPKDTQAALAFHCPIWLLPLRDVLSVAVMLASYRGRQVDWRGHTLQAETPTRPAVTFRPPHFARHVSPD